MCDITENPTTTDLPPVIMTMTAQVPAGLISVTTANERLDALIGLNEMVQLHSHQSAIRYFRGFIFVLMLSIAALL